MTKKFAIGLLLLNGLTASYGGFILIIDPSGSSLQMPLELLSNTIFRDYLIPGIILFLINGLFNLFTAFLGMKNSFHFPLLTIFSGVFLVSWLSIQILMIGEFFAYAHVPYYLIGIGQIFMGMLMTRNH